MPNIKSAKKRVKVIKAKTLKNQVRKSALRTSIRKTKELIDAKDAASIDSLKVTTSLIDKAAAKKLLHKNTAARKKSRLAKALNKANAANQ